MAPAPPDRRRPNRGDEVEFERLAIVDRGEAAMRCLHAVADLDAGSDGRLTSIAVFTEPDRDAWFVRNADESISLGPATYVDLTEGTRKLAYLDHERLLDALVRAGADAVWVGWGLLAEQAAFARQCEEAGLVFVGPSSEVIRRVGDKIASKRVAEAAGVPVVPWSGDAVPDAAAALRAAEVLGYPVALKASAGGGGRAIRMVGRPDELPVAFEAARAEAVQELGDPTLFVEQRIAGARHLEVQVIGDRYGTVWATGVRDCSVQRANRKVLEESASTVLSPREEERIAAAAIRMCHAADYVNAGAVEFLYDPAAQQALFLEMTPRLPIGHPVTELVTGLDLVRLQLHVARGGRLEGTPPAARGHTIEARLKAEDPEQGFVAAPGRIVGWRPPSGPGVRVETGVTEGDRIVAEFDPTIAKVLAYGLDRDEALARLRRALAETLLVVEGGMTDKAFLLELLDRPEVREGRFDTAWLDGVLDEGGLLPTHRERALLYAATDAYEVDRAADQAHFYAEAARGRPQVPDEVGHRVVLRFQGESYPLTVYRRGSGRYRIAVDSTVIDVGITALGRLERRMQLGGQVHRVVAHRSGPELQVEVDGRPHRIGRDEGGAVRADAPALVVSIAVSPGDDVAAGDPLLVLESMKMERTLAAPYAGRVTAVHVAPHVQVDPGTGLVELEPVPSTPEGATAAPRGQQPGGEQDVGGLLDLGSLPTTDAAPDPASRRDRLYADLRTGLLGYDLDAATLRGLAGEVVAVDQLLPVESDDVGARAALAVLDLFADLAALSRRAPIADDPELAGIGAGQEHLLTYLAWLDPARSGVPERFLERLRRALASYDVPGLERTPALEEALYWMYRSFVRLGQLAPALTAILERWAAAGSGPAVASDSQLRALLHRLAVVAEGRYPAVSDLARELRFRIFDEPVLERARAEVYAEMDAVIDELAAEPAPDRRAELIHRLVVCHQPLRARLRDRYREGGRTLREALLEANIRRFYRIRPLQDVATVEVDGRLLGVADYPRNGDVVHLVSTYGDLADLERVLGAARREVEAQAPDRHVVLGLSLWRSGAPLDVTELSEHVAARLAAGWTGPRLHRVDVTVTTEGRRAEHVRTQHVSYRHLVDGFVEELRYRNLHPMLAKRLELWRLSEFDLTRLASVEDVYLFHATARSNPKDERLIAVAEVRDLTPIRDGEGRITALPHLERMGLETLDAIRHAQARRPPRERLHLNQVVLYVRPAWTVSPDVWRSLANRFGPPAIGLGLEKVLLRVRIPEATVEGSRDAVIVLENIATRGLTVRLEATTEDLLAPLSDYGQKVLKADRMGFPYPYELLRLIAPPPGVSSSFPTGGFTEHDLQELDENVLLPVDREPGCNTAGVVIGIVHSITATVPEGMRRVAILGDPTRSLGALAEAECRRIIGAIDLAERLQLPVEWYALSAGALISMASGTENMDWIGAVLRRIIEFTQAGGEINVVVTGINVGAQPYWNAEATMLMHTRGVLIMTPQSAMVLTGKQSLDFSGGVSAEDNLGIGGYERIMGPNAQAQYWAPNVEAACAVLLRHYDHTYVVPGERFPRRATTVDPVDRDVRDHPHERVEGTTFERVGDLFSPRRNAERKQPFDIRSVMRAVSDLDHEPLERWRRWRDAEMAVVWDVHVGGLPVCMLGIESRNLPRQGFVPADGPPNWTSGTLFPQASRKVARAINGASGNRPVVVLANLSGFDGSPESMRKVQLEFGAEIGRAVTNFDGPIVFVVVSRYHGGAFVVFSKTLNDQLEIAAVEGSYASVIGGAPAAGVVFAREVTNRADQDPRVVAAREEVAAGRTSRAEFDELFAEVRTRKLGEMAAEFDAVHSIQRALQVGSVDRIIAAADLRPYVVDALERGIARTLERDPSAARSVHPTV
jgi:acetyl/propionyl-CoA carboxylase alpha subunit/acetyl-CoA carboxylase carboxyltransferase component